MRGVPHAPRQSVAAAAAAVLRTAWGRSPWRRPLARADGGVQEAHEVHRPGRQGAGRGRNVESAPRWRVEDPHEAVGEGGQALHESRRALQAHCRETLRSAVKGEAGGSSLGCTSKGSGAG